MTWAPVPVPAGTWTQTTFVSISQSDSDIVLTPNPIHTTGTVGLSTTGVTAGTYGDSTHVPRITIDAKGRILVAVSTAIAGGGGSGTVTSLSVASANGFAGTVATPTTTPVITLQATPVGVLKSDGTTLSAAAAATDYVAPGRATSSGITMATAKLLGRTSGSTGAVEELAIGGILTFTAGVLSTTPVGGSGTVTSVNADGGTTGITFTGGPITGAGTFTAGGILLGVSGGTGVANTGKTITLGGNLSLTGAFATAIVAVATATYTLPASTATLASLALAETLTNKTISGASNTITNVPLTTGVTGILAIANGGTNTATSTGTGSVVLANSPTLITPNLGTPSAIVLTSGTGLPLTTGITGMAAGIATFLATPSSANLITAVTDETGTGALVFATNPVLVTPNLGTPSAGVMTNVTGLPLTSAVVGILASTNGGTGINNAKTITVAGNFVTTGAFTTTITAVATATYTLPGATDTLAGVTSTQTLTNKTLTSPILTTPALGTASATSVSADTFLVTANNVISTTTISYTLADTDNGKAIFMNTTALNTVFVGTGRVAGFGCLIVQEGAGTTGITTNSTAVTLNSYTTQRKLLGQFAAASLIARGTNTYYLAGMLTT